MQKKAICRVTVSPMRAQPKDPSEMVSQLLFGELVEIIEERKNWTLISSFYDNYQGWVDPKQIVILKEEEYIYFIEKPEFVSTCFDFANLNETLFPLTLGAEIRTKNKNEIHIGDEILTFDGERIQNCFGRDKLIELAYLYLNTPYLWGGKSTFGIDCSGFTQMCYKMCGHFLPRDASQQAEIGTILSFVEEAEKGDLAFFENNEGKIIHVGIILEEGKIIHAHGKIRIDTLDHTGIYNKELNKYSHKLRVIRKVIP